MVKLVITSGCSFTAGIELDDYKDNWEEGLEESQLIWSYKIKEKLWPDADFFNAAKSGASNSTIARKTIYYTGEFLKKYNPRDIVVLIMWTGVDRREWRLTTKNDLDYKMSDFKYENTTATDASILQEKNIKNIMKEFYHPVWTNYRKSYLKKQGLDKIIVNYYKNLIDKETSMYDTLKNIEYTSLFLDNNNVSYYYTNSDRHIFDYAKDIDKRDMFNDRLLKSVDPNNKFFSLNNAGFTEFTYENKFANCKFGHPDKEAHAEYGKLMADWIKK